MRIVICDYGLDEMPLLIGEVHGLVRIGDSSEEMLNGVIKTFIRPVRKRDKLIDANFRSARNAGQAN